MAADASRIGPAGSAPTDVVGAMRVLAAATLVAAGAFLLGTTHGWRQGAALLLGAGLGFALFHAAFGFAGAFRRVLAERRSRGVRAQLLLLGLCVALFFPALAAGTVLGQPVRGFVFPIGVALVVGAFLFGIGMQLGGGCASGTLYAAGGGQGVRPWVTFAAFVAGATLAAWGAEGWMHWPALPPLSLLDTLGGAVPAALASLALLGALWVAGLAVERRRHGHVETLRWHGERPALPRALLFGPWPLLWGAVALAALNFATLLVAGRPWAITAAFPLWGSRAIEALGWDDPAFWPYWEDPTRAEALLRPLLADRTTVMDLGLLGGAFLAAALAAARRRPPTELPPPQPASMWRPASASLLGGLLLGVGAVLATGCNITALVGGIASGSLHGWAWIGPALLGNLVGLHLRPVFRLGAEPHAGTPQNPSTNAGGL